jgi:hypothetical protein
MERGIYLNILDNIFKLFSVLIYITHKRLSPVEDGEGLGMR